MQIWQGWLLRAKMTPLDMTQRTRFSYKWQQWRNAVLLSFINHSLFIHFFLSLFWKSQRFPGTRHTIIAIMYWFSSSVLLTLCSVARFQCIIVRLCNCPAGWLFLILLNSLFFFLSIERLVFQLLLWGSFVFQTESFNKLIFGYIGTFNSMVIINDQRHIWGISVI